MVDFVLEDSYRKMYLECSCIHVSMQMVTAGWFYATNFCGAVAKYMYIHLLSFVADFLGRILCCNLFRIAAEDILWRGSIVCVDVCVCRSVTMAQYTPNPYNLWE